MVDYFITYAELTKIINGAKDSIVKMNLPLCISTKEVEQYMIANIAVIESTLMYLNSKGLLNKTVKFEYTDVSANYEADIGELEPKK